MPLTIGTKAPDFALKTKNAEGLQEIRLSANFGKKNTVLLFVPLAFTSVCSEELCSVSGGLSDYKGLDAEVYGISVDSPFAQEAWAQKAGITFPLLSDLNKTTAQAYDVYLKDLGGLGIGDTAARAAFVIGKDGVIAYAEQTPTPKDLPNFAAVKAALAKLA